MSVADAYGIVTSGNAGVLYATFGSSGSTAFSVIV
jgi:hypothetical protein